MTKLCGEKDCALAKLCIIERDIANVSATISSPNTPTPDDIAVATDFIATSRTIQTQRNCPQLKIH